MKLPLPGGFHFTNALDALHALGNLRVVNDARLAGGLDERARLVLAVQIGGAAQVLAAVLRINPTEVHGNVTEVVDGREARLVRQGLAVEEPFDAHVRIAHRRQLALELCHLHLLQFQHVLQLRHESTEVNAKENICIQF